MVDTQRRRAVGADRVCRSAPELVRAHDLFRRRDSVERRSTGRHRDGRIAPDPQDPTAPRVLLQHRAWRDSAAYTDAARGGLRTSAVLAAYGACTECERGNGRRRRDRQAGRLSETRRAHRGRARDFCHGTQPERPGPPHEEPHGKSAPARRTKVHDPPAPSSTSMPLPWNENPSGASRFTTSRASTNAGLGAFA